MKTLFRLLGYIMNRLRQERGFFRLVRDIKILINRGGLKGLFHEMEEIGQQEQRPFNIEKAYDHWIAKYDFQENRDKETLLERCALLKRETHFGIILVSRTDDGAQCIIQMLNKQIYKNWNIIKAHDVEKVDFVTFINEGDVLAPNALAEIALLLDKTPQVDLIYCDEDQITKEGRRHSPVFKPAWNSELLLSSPYLGHTLFLRKNIFEKFNNELSENLLLTISTSGLCAYELLEQTKIAHLPRVLYHCMEENWAKNHHDILTENTYAKIVQTYLDRNDIKATVKETKHQINHIKYDLADPIPSISVIIPTRDGLAFLRQAVDGVLNETDYSNLEIIIVDNDSEKPETFEFFRSFSKNPKVKIITHPGIFNYSAIINHAVREAKGDYVCLFNNDIAIIHPSWLTEMVSLAEQENVGAVGAKLLYADNRIQHAGVMMGIKDVAGHIFKFFDRDHNGYQNRLQCTQQLLAVTAACLVVDKQKFWEVNGFNEDHLAVNFNDVDFCLKLHEAGYKNIYTPFAELYHLESASRGIDLSPEQVERANRERDFIKSKWGHYIENDPFHSINLSKKSDSFELLE